MQQGPDPHTWWKVSVMVGAGLLLALSAAMLGGGAGEAPPAAPAESPPTPPVFGRGVAAYREQRWDEAARAFAQVLRERPDHPRAADYLQRIELTRADARRLENAEHALEQGQPERAARLCAHVPPASPLFAQAEALERRAREIAEAAARGGAAGPPGDAPAALRTAPATAPAETRMAEARRLYRERRFEAAAQLAQQAADATSERRKGRRRRRWAQDAARLAELWGATGRAAAGDEAAVQRAVALDERLGGVHGRALRSRLADARVAQARDLLAQGRSPEGCRLVHAAARTAPNRPHVVRLRRRCSQEAARVLRRAEALRTRDEAAAAALYRDVLALTAQGDLTRRAARRALSALGKISAP